jgi:hypothetical protein
MKKYKSVYSEETKFSKTVLIDTLKSQVKKQKGNFNGDVAEYLLDTVSDSMQKFFTKDDIIATIKDFDGSLKQTDVLEIMTDLSLV